MSHIVSIQSKIKDVTAVEAACRRMNVPIPVVGTAELYGGSVNGLLVRLPDWLYPAVIDLATGDVKYDNYEGTWGDQAHLDRFLQLYAVEKARIEAAKKGYAMTEQTLQDGSIKLNIIERA